VESEVDPPVASSLWTGPREDPRRYRVDLVDGSPQSVGGGGEGLVFQAHRDAGGREIVVALKMHTALTLDDFDRFRDRTRALTGIDHPNVMHLVDSFVGTALIDDADPGDDEFSVMYTVAEWIPGLSLPAAIEARSKASGLRWVAEVARAADYLHRFRSPEAPAGLVHRDIKPSNVRVTPQKKAVLIDFGIARPHQEGDHTEGAGTYLWKAPEIVGGPGVPGPASDAWGIGALAYWVLLGEPPRLDGAAAARELLTPAARSAGFVDPKGLSRRISDLLEIHPERRDSNLRRWADELELRAGGKRPFPVRRAASLAAALVVLAGGATATTIVLTRTTPPSPAKSRQLAAQAIKLLPKKVELGSLLSVESYRQAPTPQARSALNSAVEQPLDGVLHTSGLVSSVAYGSDGSLIAGADKLGNVFVWNTNHGTQVHHFHVTSAVTSLAISPNDQRIAIGDVQGDVIVRNLSPRSAERFTKKLGRAITALAFNSDSSVVAAATTGTGNSGVHGELMLWNPKTGATNETNPPQDIAITSVALDPNGLPIVAFGSGDSADIWLTDASTPDHKILQLAINGSEALVSTVAFSPDGRTLADGTAGGDVALWAVTASGVSVNPTAVLSNGGVVDGLRFSHTGGVLAAGNADGDVTEWDDVTHERIGEFAADKPVSQFAFSPDLKTFATGNESDVTVWHSRLTGKELRPEQADSLIDSVASSQVGELVATSNYVGDVVLWDAQTGVEIRQLAGSGSPAHTVALSRDGTLVATGDEKGNVEVWDTLNGNALWIRNDGSLVESVAFNAAGTMLASGDVKNQSVLRSASTGVELHAPLPEVHGSVRSVAFTPNGKVLATGDTKGLVKLWSTATDKMIRVIDPKGGTVWSVAFNPADSVLAAGDDKGTTLWAVPQYTLFQRLPDPSSVRTVAFNPRGTTLATGDHRSVISTWDVASGSEVGASFRQKSAVYSVVFTADGSHLVAADDADTAIFVPTVVVSASGAQLAEQVCAEVRGNLSPDEWSRYLQPRTYQKVCPSY
jgi:WD40 repeat protein